MDFGQLQPGAHVRGIDTDGIAEIIQVRSFGPDALNLVFRVNGKIGERLLYRGDEIPFELVQPGRAYAFDADGALLRLVSEAWRLRLAHLFDPYLGVWSRGLMGWIDDESFWL